MESLKLNRTQMQMEIYGEKYKVRKPNLKEVEAMQIKLESVDKSKTFPVMKKFVSDLGIPTKVLDELEMEHLLQVTDFLIGSKKN